MGVQSIHKANNSPSTQCPGALLVSGARSGFEKRDFLLLYYSRA